MRPTTLIIVGIYAILTIPYTTAYNSDLFECRSFEKDGLLKQCEIRKGNCMFWVCFVLYIDVFGVSMRFCIRLGIYGHIEKYV